ncbi:MAG TPA: hypothetical protein VLT33_35620 [Labilithrix sp.]|nr:hypothetical protein [Labilithrix sp.]
MARSAQLALLLGLAAAGAGCGLVYDLSKLGPGADDAGSGDAADAAVVDAGPPTCPSGRGSPMIGAASFCIDARETTNAQYAAYLADTKKTGKRPTLPPTCNFKEELTPGSVVPAEGELPVRNVDWCASQCAGGLDGATSPSGSMPARRRTASSPSARCWAARSFPRARRRRAHPSRRAAVEERLPARELRRPCSRASRRAAAATAARATAAEATRSGPAPGGRGPR